MKPNKKNEALLRKYLGLPDLPASIKKGRGRPRKLDPKNKGLQEGEKRYSFIAKKKQIEAIMIIKSKTKKSLKDSFSEALEAYILKHQSYLK
jgi:hypothetical protein